MATVDFSYHVTCREGGLRESVSPPQTAKHVAPPSPSTHPTHHGYQPVRE